MSIGATVRVMSAEEIAARAGGGEAPFIHWPQRATVFAEREMRLRQLAPGHAMQDFLRFMAELAHAQQARLAVFPSVPLPDAVALDRAARRGMPPLSASEWPRDGAWRHALRALAAELRDKAPAGAATVLSRLAEADDDWLEGQADCLLTGVMHGLDLASAPIVAAALQVYWTHLVLAVQQGHAAQGQPFGRTDDATACPCCGSRPTASITRNVGDLLGQRYLHCSLCNVQWHMQRIRCTHCLSDKQVAYHSLDAADADDETSRAANVPVLAETCDDCDHYLKIMHTDRDPFVDPVADDLASLTLDLLVSEAGKQRHGVNLLLLFGDPGGP